MNEDVHVEHGFNYAGFEEKMYKVKRSRIVFVPLTDGKAGTPSIGIRDTCELGHLQFSPTDRNKCMYCHEGPWHLVMQRIFIADTDTMEVFPCFRQNKEDSVGHEFWTRDGKVFFDNRGPGHDGTITSHRTQAVAKEIVESGFIPYVGLADKTGALLFKTLLPHYCNHYHCGSDPNILVGDEVDDLVRIELTKDGPRIAKLCRHGTSWYGQKSHCHPTVSWEDDAVLYASDLDGKVQLYLMDWPN
jgi:oligogalacturonide lyase